MPGTQTEYEFDIFISYSSSDKVWVRGELLERIEQAGLNAFIDFRDFTRGAPSIKEMERGVRNCRKTLLVLSPNYIQSEWCEIENIMAETLSPANRDLRTIPLLNVECQKPLRIAALTHIDFTDGADLELAWRQLLTALGRPPEPEAPKEPRRDDWFLAHPYPMPPNFTGRAAEREMLSKWLDSDVEHPLLVIRALGGFGKSALVWQWLMHDAAPEQWTRVVWWSFYEGDDSFSSFLESSLIYLRAGDPAQLGPRQRVDALLERLRQPGTLLILDGFERLLRSFGGINAAYQGDEAGASANDRDCLSSYLEIFLRSLATLPEMRGKVLLTTRLRPSPLETHGGILLIGCREEELRQMQPSDAVEFFQAQGIRGTHTEIEQACEPYGFHPLSLRLLAGLIVADFQQPGDIAVAKRLNVSGDLIQRRHHVLETAFNSLTSERQSLMGTIACFRSPVKYEALKALTGSAVILDADLRDLIRRGLLHHDTKELQFDLHPIVRRYAYDQLSAFDRAAVHTCLRDYFAAAPQPDKVTRLEDLAPVIELYHHTVRSGQFDEACKLLSDRLVPSPLHFQFGAYHLIIELLRQLFPDGEDRPPRLKSNRDRSWAACSLGSSYSSSGQPRNAAILFNVSMELDEREQDKENVIVGLVNLSSDQIKIGALLAAEENLHRSIALGQEIKDEFTEAAAHSILGKLLAYCGAYVKAETELTMGLEILGKRNNVQAQGIVWSKRALNELLRQRSASRSESSTPRSALDSARRALKLADETARILYSHERDYVRAYWLLGAAMSFKAQTPTWSLPSLPSLAVTNPPRLSTRRQAVASLPATACLTIRTKPPMTKPERCLLSWSPLQRERMTDGTCFCVTDQ